MSMRHCTCCDRQLPSIQFASRNAICRECAKANRSESRNSQGVNRPSYYEMSYYRDKDLRRAMRAWLQMWETCGTSKALRWEDRDVEAVDYINAHPERFGYVIVRSKAGLVKIEQIKYCSDGHKATKMDENIPIGFKRCSRCEKLVKFQEIYPKSGMCRPCKREYNKEYRRKNYGRRLSRAKSTAGS